MTTSVVVRHTAGIVHRLSAGGVAASLHGHAWTFEVTATGDPNEDGQLLNFGTLHWFVGGFLDEFVDHATLLGADDPLVAALRAEGCTVFVFDPADPGSYTAGRGSFDRPLASPTMGNVAELVRRATVDFLARAETRGLGVRVQVSDTQGRTAALAPGAPW